MHSSGSTGVPEALALVFSSFIENTKQVSNFLNLNNKDIHLGTFSFCYMSGFYNAFHTCSELLFKTRVFYLFR